MCPIPISSPHATGTGQIEQLSSFAVRYAAEMHLAFVTFFRERIATRLYSDWSERERVSLVSKVVIDGITKTAGDWADALEQVTGASNRALCTMLPFAGTIASRRLVTTNRRWCPICRKRHLKAVSTSTLRVSKVMSITSSSGDHFDDRDRLCREPQGAAELRA
jgi:hypothetical protein